MKKLSKYIFNHKKCQIILSYLAYGYSWLVYKTCRWQNIGTEHIVEFKAGKPFILVLWHNRLFMAPHFAPSGRHLHAVISIHNDGQYVAQYMELHGIYQIRGSSKKGGFLALKQSMKVLQNREVLVITPDGPRGPREQIHGNVISIARIHQVPIIPFAYATRHKKEFNSWDRFIFPFPFCKGATIYGKPFYISPQEDEEQIRLNLQKALVEVTKQVDDLVTLP